MPAFRHLSARLLGLCLVALLGACAGALGPRLSAPERADQEAQALLRRGEPAAAAQAYLRLAARSPGTERYRYDLQAAEAYIEARRVPEAQRLLEGAAVPETEPDWVAWRVVLLARVALLQHDAARALTLLQPLQRGDLSASVERQIHHERARAYGALGRGVDAARAYVREAALLSDPAALDANAEATWAAIAPTDPATLSRELAGLEGDLAGWVELARISRSRWLDDAALGRALADWQARYPAHPALSRIVPTLAAHRTSSGVAPRRIALLLPQGGQYADAARAIQDGFIAAWYEDRGADPERTVSVYDANPANVQAVYDQAVEEGADFVVGPLEKPAIQSLLGRGVLTVPTLALNQIDRVDSAPAPAGAPALYQFSLSPEDEARQIAERAWLDGGVRALVIAPASPWGERVVGAFRRHWESLGGRIAASKTYRGAARDYAEAVQALVGPGGRATPAADPGAFVFMVATPQDGRQILPQLRQSVELPIYATSHVYAGTRATEADSDLDGVVFPDMPWMLAPERVSLRQVLARHFSRSLREQSRLLAFGVDAYGLIARLADLQSDPVRGYEGVTGTLHLDGTGRIQRNLLWGRFSAGQPVLLEP